MERLWKKYQCYLTLNKNKHDIQKFRGCIRSNSEKRGSENKQKLAFLPILANKDSFCSGIQTHFSWNCDYRSIILSDVLAIHLLWKQIHKDFS